MAEDVSLIPAEARARIGTETGRAQGRVVRQEFQRWAAAVKDRNPLYFDADFARVPWLPGCRDAAPVHHRRHGGRR